MLVVEKFFCGDLRAETFTAVQEKNIFSRNNRHTHILFALQQPSSNIDSSFLTIELLATFEKMFRQIYVRKKGQSNSDFR